MEPQSDKDLLSGLPNEIIQKILQDLTLAELRKLGLTAHQSRDRLEVSRSFFESRLEFVQKTFTTSREVSKFVNAMMFQPLVSFKFAYDLQFKNKGETFFSEVFGPRVKRIHVTSLNPCMAPFEWNFFQTMVQLKVLHVKTLKRALQPANVPILPFESLNEFSFDHARHPSQLKHLLEKMPNLSRLSVGRIGKEEDGNEKIQSIFPFLRGDNKILHFNGLNLGFNFSVEMGQFLNYLISFKVKIENIDGRFVVWILKNFKSFNWELEQALEFLALIQQMNSVYPQLTRVCMPSLKKVIMRVDATNCQEMRENCGGPYIMWDKLQEFQLEIVLPAFNLFPGGNAYSGIVCFLSFLMDIKRPSLTTLILKTNFFDTRYILTPRKICTSFENLSNLVLDLPFFENNEYTTLFQQLGAKTQVTSISLTVACSLEYSTFTGGDEEMPAFLTIANLRHFYLRFRAFGENRGILPAGSTINWNGHKDIFSILSRSKLTCFSLISPRCDIFPITPAGLQDIMEGQMGIAIRHFNLQIEDIWSINLQQQLKAIKDKCFINKSRRIIPPNDKEDSCKYCFSF